MHTSDKHTDATPHNNKITTHETHTRHSTAPNRHKRICFCVFILLMTRNSPQIIRVIQTRTPREHSATRPEGLLAPARKLEPATRGLAARQEGRDLQQDKRQATRHWQSEPVDSMPLNTPLSLCSCGTKPAHSTTSFNFWTTGTCDMKHVKKTHDGTSTICTKKTT